MKLTLQNSTSALLGLIITTARSERERGGDWAVQHQPIIRLQYAKQETRLFFWHYSTHQPLFPSRKHIQPIPASYHILLRFLKSQPSIKLCIISSLENLPSKNCWEINSTSKENSISQILLTAHRPPLRDEKLHNHLDFESNRQEFSLTKDSLSLLLGILMILQDLFLKGKGKIHASTKINTLC